VIKAQFIKPLVYIRMAASINESRANISHENQSMKLHLTTAQNQNLITGYGTDFIEINRKKYTRNLIVLANKLVENWQVTDFAALSEVHFEYLLESKPEVVLLGTGGKHQFLHPKMFRKLTESGISLECMTTAAACRTYNILMSEGRNVAAALIL
jgi:uncharacterized protein